MQSAALPQIRVEPELPAELEPVLQQGEALPEFIETTVLSAIAFRRVQHTFHARARAASQEFHQAGVSMPIEHLLKKLQAKLEAKRRKLGR
jgi:hypothetical protein